MKILIVYGTTEGQTRKIARFLKEEAERAGHSVSLFDATENPPWPEGFDVVIIGASIHAGKYQNAVTHYVKTHHDTLNKIVSVFYSVSLAAVGTDRESLNEVTRIAAQFCENNGWKPRAIEHVAGALLYTHYDFFKRFIMRLIMKKHGGNTDTSHDYEYTDWEKVREGFKKFLKKTGQPL